MFLVLTSKPFLSRIIELRKPKKGGNFGDLAYLIRLNSCIIIHNSKNGIKVLKRQIQYNTEV